MDNEDFIKSLPPELQEKARACKNVEELATLAKEAGCPLPDEVLAQLAGGAETASRDYGPFQCPNCKSMNTRYRTLPYSGGIEFVCDCKDCGCHWVIS